MFKDKVVITGGTGSFVKKLTETVLSQYRPQKPNIFRRDELKQFEMCHVFHEGRYPA